MIGSLFSGIGGLELGLERAGLGPVAWQVEIDKSARSVLAHHWPDVERHEDVRQFHPSSTVDVLCGGFPCQDLSVAGRRAGLAGERSGLFWEAMRIAAESRPRWIVLENVPGLLHSNGGRDMGTVLGALGKLGYWWAYASLDAQFFGVAQRRERVFIVGHLGADRAAPAKVLLEPTSVCGNPPARGKARQDVAGTLGGGAQKRGWCDDTDRMTFIADAPPVSLCLSEGGRFDGESETFVTAFDTTQITSAMNRSNPKPGDACHPLAAGAHPPSIASTLVSQSGAMVRRLTPLECERLQGFPDGWSIPAGSDSARYRCLGNAVCVNVAEWIGRRIAEVEASA